MKKILVPKDFSLNADEVLDFSVIIATQADTEIYFMQSARVK